MMDNEWKDRMLTTIRSLSLPTTKICASCDTTHDEIAKRICAIIADFSSRECTREVLLSLFAIIVRSRFNDTVMLGMVNEVLRRRDVDELPITTNTSCGDTP